jgi:ADP-heptose:LPS heptosyltransferase
MPIQSVLIFRIGSLGDVLVALPSLWAIREHFAGAKLTMLCDYHPGYPNVVLGPDLLRGSGIVDDFMFYPVDHGRFEKVMRPVRKIALAARLRARGFDALVYLPPSIRPAEHIIRDARFFRLAGISQQFGTVPVPFPATSTPMVPIPREADMLLARLAAAGIPTPPPNHGRVDLALNAQDIQAFEAWRNTLPSDGGRRWISVGPGGKKPVSFWPIERYEQLIRRLIDQFDVWPVIFGGKEDIPNAKRLVFAWGRGHIAAGALGLRATAVAMRNCAFHVGNDTGTMHLAAAAPVRCVGIFSAHAPPGQWSPYGPGHIVLRKTIDCEGCKLFECIERKMECIMSISVDEVFQACETMMQSQPQAEVARF